MILKTKNKQIKKLKKKKKKKSRDFTRFRNLSKSYVLLGLITCTYKVNIVHISYYNYYYYCRQKEQMLTYELQAKIEAYFCLSTQCEVFSFTKESCCTRLSIRRETKPDALWEDMVFDFLEA